jgi:AAA family ATP:ADP antiporter
VVCIKSFKYIFFDPTKERAYIPLDEESKVRGKAAVDGVGSRLGKGFGSVLITVLVSLFGSIGNVTYLILSLVLFSLVAWLFAVNKLSILLKKPTEEEKAENQDETDSQQ